MNPSVIKDRRAHERHPLRTDVALLLPDGRQIAGRTLDIGKGGMAAVIDLNPAFGLKVSLRARLPQRNGGSATFDAQATVQSSVLATADGGFRIGLQFLPLAAPAQAVLKQFLP